jgi:thiosulfate/3-mercaptopyruvate sulfurtransferase
MATRAYTTLIEPLELAALARASDPAVIIDCRHDLTRPEWGAEAYAESHVPDAELAHLDRDLAGPVTAASGRHPLPAPDRLTATFSRWGIDRDRQVVAYDQSSGAYAARLWWLLRYLGHSRVAVLNGGLQAWRSAGLPMTRPAASTRAAAPSREPRRFEGSPQLPRAASTAEVAEGVARGDIVLIDARSADRFAGRNETIDPVAGHVPGARNHPFTRNLDAAGRFLAPPELSTLWRETLAGSPSARVVSMCGSGVTACHNLLAMELAGLEGARLYAGSWSEWIRDPARPVARS